MPNFGKKVGSRGLQRCQDMVFRIFWMAEELPNTSQGHDLKAKPKSGRMMQRHLKFAVGAGDFEGAGAKLGLQARWLEENAEVVAPLTSPTPSTALWTCSYAFVGCGCRRIRGPLPASATAGRAPTRPKSTANFHSERMTSLKSARWKNSWRRGAATDCHGKTCWIRCDITSVSGTTQGRASLKVSPQQPSESRGEGGEVLQRCCAGRRVSCGSDSLRLTQCRYTLVESDSRIRMNQVESTSAPSRYQRPSCANQILHCAIQCQNPNPV